MKRLKGITILSVASLFAVAGSMAQDAVPGAQLELIASEANFVREDWKNLGIAGGVLRGGKKLLRDTPVFEPAAGGELARFTAVAERQFFGSIFGSFAKNAIFHLQDWTVELILKRNGPSYGKAHHVAGFYFAAFNGWWMKNTDQWIMLGFMENDTGKM